MEAVGGVGKAAVGEDGVNQLLAVAGRVDKAACRVRTRGLTGGAGAFQLVEMVQRVFGGGQIALDRAKMVDADERPRFGIERCPRRRGRGRGNPDDGEANRLCGERRLINSRQSSCDGFTQSEADGMSPVIWLISRFAACGPPDNSLRRETSKLGLSLKALQKLGETVWTSRLKGRSVVAGVEDDGDGLVGAMLLFAAETGNEVASDVANEIGCF